MRILCALLKSVSPISWMSRFEVATMSLKSFVLNNRFLAPIAIAVKQFPREIVLYFDARRQIRASEASDKRIFYLGVPAHKNLGDLAQGVCIRRWCLKHYPDHKLVEIETNALVNTHFSCLGLIEKSYRKSDFVIFQSGYTTTDLGGFADEMHQAVIRMLPDARILMMPQTIFFKDQANEKKCARCYNSAKKMMFIARDSVSYDKALSMFPDLDVCLCPDIVTTMIGERFFPGEREGILFCFRNDSEKLYTDYELNSLMTRCEQLATISRDDTTKSGSTRKIVAQAEDLVNAEIAKYAQYKVVVTDRFHGTIFALAAATPVVVLRTTDHKVAAGAEWFEDVYGEYIRTASSLDEAFGFVADLLSTKFEHRLTPYFEKRYYDELVLAFEGDK